MAHRMFKDGSGRLWDVWDVHPTAIERRAGAERRRWPREGLDRRRSQQPRLVVPEHLRDGWLAFETRGERRRLVPIPTGWMTLADGELARLADRATKASQAAVLSQ